MALSGKIPEFTSEQCDSMDGRPVGKLIRGFSGMQRLPCSPTKDGGPDTRSANFKELLKRATEGDANSEERLCETVNDELRRVALRMSAKIFVVRAGLFIGQRSLFVDLSQVAARHEGP